MFVGIPTLNRYDLLRKCLDSLEEGELLPSQVCVIDNGGAWASSGTWSFPVWVVTPHRNLGVAASWNLLKRIAGAQDIVLLNDDVVMARDTLYRMQECSAAFVTVCDTPGFEARALDPGVRVSDWSCCLHRHRVWQSVGDYDEKFWPGGYEDSDYWRRMKLLGIAVTRLPQNGMVHQVSSTLAAMSRSERKELDECTARNDAYYREKWGGAPGWEEFTSPSFAGERTHEPQLSSHS